MTKRACSQCGSRNWPRKGAECPLCREEESDEAKPDERLALASLPGEDFENTEN